MSLGECEFKYNHLVPSFKVSWCQSQLWSLLAPHWQQKRTWANGKGDPHEWQNLNETKFINWHQKFFMVIALNIYNISCGRFLENMDTITNLSLSVSTAFITFQMIFTTRIIWQYLANPGLVCLFVEDAVSRELLFVCWCALFVCFRVWFVCCRESKAGKNCLQFDFFSTSFSGLSQVLTGPRWIKFGWAGFIWGCPLGGLVGLRLYGFGLEGPGRTGWGFWTGWWVASGDP